MDKLDIIIPMIVELSLEQDTSDPVRAIHSVTMDVDNRIEAIMCELREQERLIEGKGGDKS